MNANNDSMIYSYTKIFSVDSVNFNIPKPLTEVNKHLTNFTYPNITTHTDIDHQNAKTIAIGIALVGLVACVACVYVYLFKTMQRDRSSSTLEAREFRDRKFSVITHPF